MAVSPDRAVRRMDSSFFLFLYTPDQQRRADRAVHDSGGGKVQYCEEIYRRWGTPAIFKISPLVNPGFDAMLADRGYVVQHRRTS